jgi:hypothetical protein
VADVAYGSGEPALVVADTDVSAEPDAPSAGLTLSAVGGLEAGSLGLADSALLGACASN